MGPTWVLSAPEGPHVGPMNFAIGVVSEVPCTNLKIRFPKIFFSSSNNLQWFNKGGRLPRYNLSHRYQAACTILNVVLLVSPMTRTVLMNSLRSEQNGHHFTDNIFKYIFRKKFCTFIPMSALVQEMNCCWTGPDDHLIQYWSRSTMLYCVSRSQWVKVMDLCKMDGKTSSKPMMTYFTGIHNALRVQDKMAAFSQMTLSNAFSWMKMLEFRLRFHWSLFLGAQLTIFQHWFR